MGWGRGAEASALPSVHSGVMVSLLRLVSEVGRISCGGVTGQMPHVLSRASCKESSLGLCPPAPRKKDGLILEQEVGGGAGRGWEAGREGL